MVSRLPPIKKKREKRIRVIDSNFECESSASERDTRGCAPLNPGRKPPIDNVALQAEQLTWYDAFRRLSDGAL